MRTYELHNFSTGASMRVTQKSYPRRCGYVVTGSYPANDPPPRNINDARAWDAWRNRNGGAVHH